MSMTAAMPSTSTMRRAFARKDAAFEGLFFVGVKTTGVFCRPTCRAKPPRAENVQFFPSARAALQQGFRPCKLCRPHEATHSPPATVRLLMRWLDEHPDQRMTEDELRKLGIDASTARRQFRAYCGMTFAAYQRQQRVARGLARLRDGGAVIDAQLDAGFESAGGFRQALARVTNGARRDCTSLRVLTSAWIDTPLGRMLAVVNDDGLLLLDFADRKGLRGALSQLAAPSTSRKEPRAIIVPGQHRHLARLHKELDEYFAGARMAFTVPLVPRGTGFQLRAWEALRAIPPGETRSYAQQAAAIGERRAVRAVARANGMNFLAIIIPCHRVVGADGHLTGYGGGLARKRWLLEHERRFHHASVRATAADSLAAAIGA